jgi:hypothetical protein
MLLRGLLMSSSSDIYYSTLLKVSDTLRNVLQPPASRSIYATVAGPIIQFIFLFFVVYFRKVSISQNI